MTDEEKEAIGYFRNKIGDFELFYGKKITTQENEYLKILLNLIEKQSKEIEKLYEDNLTLAQEIEELKKDKLELINKNHVVHIKDVEKELLEMRNALDIKNAEINILNNMIDINYISKDKIKAKVIEIKNKPVKDEFITATQGKLNTIIEIESLLERS